ARTAHRPAPPGAGTAAVSPAPGWRGRKATGPGRSWRLYNTSWPRHQGQLGSRPEPRPTRGVLLLTKTAALIVAAGRGQRFGGSLPKQYAPLAGVPLLRHTLRAFSAHPGVATVRAVIHPDDRPLYDAAVEGLDLAEPVAGGASRQESVCRGLESLAGDPPHRVLIHDGAR